MSDIETTIQMNFEQLRSMCKYCQWGFDEQQYPPRQLTCRNKDNIPQGSSWGNCNIKECPLLKWEA